MAAAVIPGTTFEGNDGNLIVNTTGNTDWVSWQNSAGLHSGVDKPSGKTDNAFGQGTKEDGPNVTVVTGAIPPNKNDLTRFYEASENIGGDTFLYLAWERAVNIGNANLDFEINKAITAGFNTSTTGDVTLNRTAGDMLVTYDFGGSGTPTLGLLRWLTSVSNPEVPGFEDANVCYSANGFPCWGDRIVLGSNIAEGAVNTVAINEVLSGVNPLGIGLFGEASINLSDAGVFPPGTCEAFGSTFVKSRSSSSFPAEVKDFIAPVPVNISNCATVITRKVTDPSPDVLDTTFSFTTNVEDSPDTSTTGFDLKNGGSKTIVNVLPGSYNTTEDGETGYTLKLLTGIDCSASTGVTPTEDEANKKATFTVDAGDVVDCTFTNTKDKANPSGASAPSLVPQDSVTVKDLDTSGSVSGTANKQMTVSLYGGNDCSGTAVYTKTFTVTSNTTFTTDNSGVAATNGYTITADGTYRWKVHYNGDSRNNPFDLACGDEQVVVGITPDPAP